MHAGGPGPWLGLFEADGRRSSWSNGLQFSASHSSTGSRYQCDAWSASPWSTWLQRFTPSTHSWSAPQRRRRVGVGAAAAVWIIVERDLDGERGGVTREALPSHAHRCCLRPRLRARLSTASLSIHRASHLGARFVALGQAGGMIGRGILDGIRVLDFTRVVAGPSCTRVLADLGAEVVKVEPPEGDLLRTGWPRRGGVSVIFAGQNAGKRFVAVDLRQAAGVDLVLRLAERCDVVVENFRPGVAARLGIGYDQVRARRPSTVYCSVSGYGQDGRAAQRRAYAPVVHAEVGLLQYKARETEREPVPEPVSHADIAAGMAAAQGVLAALFRRERTGQGAHVDASMCEAMLAANEWSAVEANGGPDYARSPFRPGKAAVVQLGDVAGTWVAVPGSPAAALVACARLWGRPELLDEPRFATMEDRSAHLDDCIALIGEFAATFTSFDAFESTMSDGARLPIGRLATMADTLEVDWAVDRGAYVEVPAGDGGKVVVHRSPLRISDADCGPRGGVGHLGADNRAVLTDVLGLTPDDLDRLESAGVIVARDDR
ncbi:MAG: hypothetical protein GEV08_00510 [Acidimicrobiia bacterium]|nr:hypothetical protein [Acidimicrobiia bacterium]